MFCIDIELNDVDDVDIYLLELKSITKDIASFKPVCLVISGIIDFSDFIEKAKSICNAILIVFDSKKTIINERIILNIVTHKSNGYSELEYLDLKSGKKYILSKNKKGPYQGICSALNIEKKQLTNNIIIEQEIDRLKQIIKPISDFETQTIFNSAIKDIKILIDLEKKYYVCATQENRKIINNLSTDLISRSYFENHV